MLFEVRGLLFSEELFYVGQKFRRQRALTAKGLHQFTYDMIRICGAAPVTA